MSAPLAQPSSRRWLRAPASGLIFACAALLALVAISAAPLRATELERLEIVSGEARHVFMVEVARDDASRQRGLMHRRFMPADRGMLFDFKVEAPVAMWMQNTFIPLDMLFIRKDGVIHRIEAMTEPMSTRTISSGAPVLSVLEINGGLAAKLGIRAGDRVAHPLFGTK
jgi:uncharacterized membrane protein (UPF0127 family)